MRKLILFLIVVLTFISSVILFNFFIPKEVNLKVRIEKGEKISKLLKRLESEGSIDNYLLSYLWVKFKGIKIKEGCYKVKGKFNIPQLLLEFEKGSPCLKSFTIKPGDTLFTVDKTLSSLSICRKGEVLKLSKDKNFLRKLNLPFLEGFLFPDTYKIAEGKSCSYALSVPVENFKQKVNPLFASYTPPKLVKKALKKVTLEKVLTVASIVEKETSLEKEKPLIAGVIYNRLIKGIKIQCDPTVFYAYQVAGIEKRKLHERDVKFPSPFNTYYAKGLPPTPICNPSLSSIKAAMYPKETEYLYFVAYKGKHYFSKSYNQHLKLIRKFYRNGKAFCGR